MATTAKQSSSSAVSSRASSSSPSPQSHHHHPAEEEDIETIAKQISDHAEAIYQTWKARGLAPTEILNCHTVGGGDTFGKALTPPHHLRRPKDLHSSVSQPSPLSAGRAAAAAPAGHTIQPHVASASVPISAKTADLLFANTTTDMSNNNNLEKLVSSFVNEDRARQQQAATSRRTATTSILTSGTIRDALRKFESGNGGGGGGGGVGGGGATNNGSGGGVAKPSFLLRNSPTSQRMSGSTTNATSPSSTPNKSTATTTATTKLCKNVPDVLMNTIEQSAAQSVVVEPSKESSPPPPLRPKPETPAKPANLSKLINQQQTWPLKNRIAAQSASPSSTPTANKKATSNGGGSSSRNGNSVAANGTSGDGSSVTDGSAVLVRRASASNKVRKSTNLLDEVLQEEERLINALKTGTVLSSDKVQLPEVITSTMQPDTDPRKWSAPDISTTATTNGSAANTKSSHSSSNPSTIVPQPANAATAASPGLHSIASTITAIAATAAAASMPHSAASDMQPSAPTATTNGNGTVIQARLADLQQKAVDLANTQDAPNANIGSLKVTKNPRPRNDAAVPHPEVNLSTIKLNHITNSSRNSSSTTAVRPFLTRGSVAERVLMFEKCPELKPMRIAPKEPSKLSTKPLPPPPEQHTTLQRRIKSTKAIYIPKFYYPHGKPVLTITSEQTLQRLQSAFDSFPNRQATKENFDQVMKICGFPRYWRMPLYGVAQLTPGGLAYGNKFIDFWKQMLVFCHDPNSRFVYIMSRGVQKRPWVQPEDLITLVQDVVDTHPGLAFLKEASEFHSRYVHTVIARIFYTVNRSWTGRISLPELRRSNLLEVLQLLEEEEDINQIMAYFSYEHFYVIYCKFWELDRDHDLFIDQNDLARHNDHALSTRIIERIFSGCVTKGAKNRTAGNAGKMSYTEFVWFLLSEEDKTHPTAVEYWFRCMDLDGDGVLSMYELEYFYEEQQHRMESIGIETLPFEDCLCQMLDMVKPKKSGFVTLGDLKRCKTTPIFFDTFFNLEKYMEHEQRDPFATQRDQDEMTDWDRYAAQEYELLVAEEGGDTQGSYDEDDEYESNIDILESQLDDCMSTMINEW